MRVLQRRNAYTHSDGEVWHDEWETFVPEDVSAAGLTDREIARYVRAANRTAKTRGGGVRPGATGRCTVSKDAREIQADLVVALGRAFGAESPRLADLERCRALAVELGGWCDGSGVISQWYSVGPVLCAIAGRGHLGSYATEQQREAWLEAWDDEERLS